MIARAGTGWQTLLADLSIILFMVTAAALSQAPAAPAAPAERAPEASARGQALAYYRAGPGMPPLGEWLARESPDPRQQLSIVAHYAPGGETAALAEAAALLAQAGPAARGARVVVEPGEDGVVASLAYDLARPLRGSSANQSRKLSP